MLNLYALVLFISGAWTAYTLSKVVWITGVVLFTKPLDLSLTVFDPELPEATHAHSDGVAVVYL